MSQDKLPELLAWWWQRLPNVEPHAAELLRELLRAVAEATNPEGIRAQAGGMVLAPREPTIAMTQAALVALREAGIKSDNNELWIAAYCWNAMIAAATPEKTP